MDSLTDIFAQVELDASTRFTADTFTYQKRQCPGIVGTDQPTARTGNWPVSEKKNWTLTIIMPRQEDQMS